MTLERSVSNPAAYDTHLSPALLSERQYYTLPTKPKSTGYLTPTKGHKNGFNFHSVLDKTISDQTFATESSLTGFSNTAWASTSSVDHSKDRKSRYRSRNYAFDDVRHNHHHHHHNHHHHSSNPHAYRHERPANGSPAKDHVDSDSKKKNHKVNNPPRESISKSAKDLSAETPEKSATLPRNSSATLPRNSSATLSRNSSATLPRNTSATLSRNSSATLNNNTCSREVLLEFPSSMPKSAGRSSHSSAAKRSEKSKELKSDRNGLNRSLQPARSMPGLAETSQKEVRPHSADGRPRERKSCSLFFLFRRKKKSREDRTPSPVSKSKQNTRSRPDNSCATPQSVTRSEHQNLSSLNDRRPSSHSSSRPLLTPTQSKPPRSPKSPTAPSSPAQPQTDRTPQYTSRSRPQQRGERRHHRTNTPASRTQSEERVRHEDLPPHPSLYKKAAEKANSNPNTPCLKSSNHRLDGLSRSRGNSDTVSNVKSAAVSSISAQNLKDSAGGSAQNLLEKSVHSTSKTDFEEDSHYQYTTSSSDRSSQRQSLRSQSLPSFGGDRLIPPDADFRVISDAEDFEYSPTDMKGPLNLSLCGCGFLGMYHLGVVSCLAQRGPAFLERVKNVGGASAGALMAAVLVTAPDKMEESAEHVQNLAKEIRRKPLGALTPGYSFTRSLRYMLDDILPEDAHELACGKLHVSMTNAQTKKNELMSDFKTRDELIEALVASCYIPVYAGLKMPTIRGKYYDGGLSDNLPRFVAGRTITVSPFDGKSDIGPKAGCEIEKKAQFINFHNQDLQVSMNNVKKGAHAFFPPKRQYLQEYFEKGRFDASRFLIREGLYEINVQQQKKSVLYESSV